MRETLFLLFYFTATIVCADSGFVFKGKIGNYPIVMTIWATASSATGTYYYVSQGKDNEIELSGNIELGTDSDIWIVTEEISGFFNGFFRVHWDRFTEEGQKLMTGDYINIKGKHVPVKLRCVKVEGNPEHC